MRAEVTYNAGASYRFVSNPRLKFFRDKTLTVSDPVVIRAAQSTKGFTVRVLEEPKKPRRRRAKAVVEEEALSVPTRIAKKVRKVAKKKVRKVVERD